MKFLPVFLTLMISAAAQQPAPPANQVEKRGITISREGARTGLGTSRLPRGFAILVGVNSAKAKFAERDAQALYDVLLSSNAGNFAEQDIRLFTGAAATPAKLREAIETWLPSAAAESDRVLFYFAGEAAVCQGKTYLALKDLDPNRCDQTAYPFAALATVLSSQVKARWKAVFTDASHGASPTPETSNQAVNQQLGNLQNGILSITASRRQESALEDPALGGGHGLFTYYLMEALKGQADRNQDGLITADELIEYVRSRVRDHAQQRSARQTPTESGDFDPEFPFAFRK